MSEDEEFLRECKWYRNCTCISHDNPKYQKNSEYRLPCPIDNMVYRIDFCRYYKPKIIIEPDILHEIIGVIEKLSTIESHSNISIFETISYKAGYREACHNVINKIISTFSESSQRDKDVTG